MHTKSILSQTELSNSDFNFEFLTDNPVDGHAVMERHYMGLSKELEKKKPNPAIINSFLNKEFSTRRVWLTDLSPGDRLEKLMEKYPCFQDHVEVIVFLIAKNGYTLTHQLAQLSH